MLLKEGTTVDRYRIDEYKAAGGMQEVYSATDTRLERKVVIKTPKTDGAERRFERSAQVSARVSHANVARTFDYVVQDHRPYLVEELVEGSDLEKLIRNVDRFDAYAVTWVLHGLARGIDAVHVHDIVHRDLKPNNVMIVGGWSFREVKITDFGVAKLAEKEMDDAVGGGTLGMTGSQTFLGHLPYLAPELFRRRKTVDKATDIWAAGAMAFHMLTGTPPFGKELADVVLRALSEPVPDLPRDVVMHPQLGGLAQEIYGIIISCLDKDPASRPSARTLVHQCGRLCYPIAEREVGTVTGYPGSTFGFAEAERGRVFFHEDSIVSSSGRPRVGGRMWFARHRGDPQDRAHPVVPLLSGET